MKRFSKFSKKTEVQVFEISPSTAPVFNAPTRLAAGARDLSCGDVSTAQTRPQNSQAPFGQQRPCGLKSALRRSRVEHAKRTPAPNANPLC
jgi:hypothetical protein